MGKNYFKFILIFLCLTIVSCGSEEGHLQEKKEESFISRSFDVVQKNIIQPITPAVDYVQYPYRYYKERSKKADSLEKRAIDEYKINLISKYSEYESVAKWFESFPPELNGLEGNYYKVLQGTIKEGKNITRTDMAQKNEQGNYQYFYETEDKFFLFELKVNDHHVSSVNVRCIFRGFGNEPMYDYVYDEKGNLIKEIYQCDVKQSLFEKDDRLYFEYSQKVEGKKLVNTIDLGETLDI